MTRDLLKTASFATLHFAVAFGVAYALTGSVAVATGIGLIEPLVNTVAFFFHEQFWKRIGPAARRPRHRCLANAWPRPARRGRVAQRPRGLAQRLARLAESCLSSVAPFPDQALPCMHASVVGPRRASLSSRPGVSLPCA